jgi:hypothetical protein
MMMGRPYRPVRELEAHLDRGELDFAIAVARTLADEQPRPLELDVSLRFLPLVAAERPQAFDVWALRWLTRWCDERAASATVDDAVEVAQGLAEIPVDPENALALIRAISPPR